MHALAANTNPYDFTSSAWPGIAQQLLREGCPWPALTELAAMDTSDDEDEIVGAVGRLAQQTRSEAEELLNTWDIVAWLIACGSGRLARPLKAVTAGPIQADMARR